MIDGVLNSSNQSAKYTVKVYFSVNTDTGTDRYHAVRLFGSNNHTISNFTNGSSLDGLNQTGKRFLVDHNSRAYFIGDDDAFNGSQDGTSNLDAGGEFTTIDLSGGIGINFAMEIYQEKSAVPVYYDDITELK